MGDISYSATLGWGKCDMIMQKIGGGLANVLAGGVEVQPSKATRIGYVVSGQLRHCKTLSLLVIGLVLSIGLSSCGKAEITADTTCKDYYTYDSQTRYDAVVRLSVELHTPDPGNPMWGPNTDYSCGRTPDATLRQILTPQ